MLRAFAAILLCSQIPSFSFASCIDLRGTYNECQIVKETAEKFSFEIQQGFKAGTTFYSATAMREGQHVQVIFLTDGTPRPLLSDQERPVVPIELTYVATCDPTEFIVTFISPTLGQAAAEKFLIAKDTGDRLRIINQSLFLGRVTQERTITCDRRP